LFTVNTLTLNIKLNKLNVSYIQLWKFQFQIARGTPVQHRWLTDSPLTFEVVAHSRFWRWISDMFCIYLYLINISQRTSCGCRRPDMAHQWTPSEGTAATMLHFHAGSDVCSLGPVSSGGTVSHRTSKAIIDHISTTSDEAPCRVIVSVFKVTEDCTGVLLFLVYVI